MPYAQFRQPFAFYEGDTEERDSFPPAHWLAFGNRDGNELQVLRGGVWHNVPLFTGVKHDGDILTWKAAHDLWVPASDVNVIGTLRGKSAHMLTDGTDVLEIRRTISDLTPTLTGSGSMEPWGDHTHASDVSYVVEIDGAGSETSATFKWSDDGGSTWIEEGVTVSFTSRHHLQSGMYVLFTEGVYDVGDNWTWTAIGTANQQYALKVDTTNSLVKLASTIQFAPDPFASAFKISSSIGSGFPGIQWATNDYMNYVTAADWLQFVQGSTLKMTLAPEGLLMASLFNFGEQGKTASGGVITEPTLNKIVVTGQGGVADDVDTITAPTYPSAPLFISPVDGTNTITLKHGTGNLLSVTNADIVLDDVHDFALAIYDDAQNKWFMAPLGGGPIDHGTLAGLTDDDHTQYILKSLADAKGDIFTATANDTPARLAVGANDSILMADSGEATGLKWAAAATTSEIAAVSLSSESAGTSDTYARGDHVHQATAYSVHTYVFPGDAPLDANVTTGDAQAAVYHHSYDSAETVKRIITEFETAPTGSAATIQLEYGDTDDLDTVASWTEIELVSHTAGAKTIITTSSFTNSSIPANRLIRMNVDAVGSTVAGKNLIVHLQVLRPVVAS